MFSRENDTSWVGSINQPVRVRLVPFIVILTRFLCEARNDFWGTRALTIVDRLIFLFGSWCVRVNNNDMVWRAFLTYWMLQSVANPESCIGLSGELVPCCSFSVDSFSIISFVQIYLDSVDMIFSFQHSLTMCTALWGNHKL